MAYNSISYVTVFYNRLIVCARYSCNFSFPLKFQLKFRLLWYMLLALARFVSNADVCLSISRPTRTCRAWTLANADSVINSRLRDRLRECDVSIKIHSVIVKCTVQTSVTLKQLNRVTTVLRSTWKVTGRLCWRIPSPSTSSLTNDVTTTVCETPSLLPVNAVASDVPSTSVCRRHREGTDADNTTVAPCRCSSSLSLPFVIRDRAESLNFASLPACSAGYSNTFN